MFKSYRIGTLFGFPIEVNLTFLLMLGAIVLWLGAFTGVLFVVIAFGSVLLHELGHALTARRLGVPVGGIELHFFGGAAKMLQQPRTASDEIKIAAAGPAVSFGLAGLGAIVTLLTANPVAALFTWLNLIMGAFNLIPALPMDGGRIFRAALSKRMGFLTATEVSITVSRVVAVAMGVIGLVTLHLYLAVLGLVLWFMGTAELHAARVAPGYRGEPFSDYDVLPRSGFGGHGPRIIHREPKRERDPHRRAPFIIIIDPGSTGRPRR